jgi:hypothetical protein
MKIMKVLRAFFVFAALVTLHLEGAFHQQPSFIAEEVALQSALSNNDALKVLTDLENALIETEKIKAAATLVINEVNTQRKMGAMSSVLAAKKIAQQKNIINAAEKNLKALARKSAGLVNSDSLVRSLSQYLALFQAGYFSTEEEKEFARQYIIELEQAKKSETNPAAIKKLNDEIKQQKIITGQEWSVNRKYFWGAVALIGAAGLGFVATYYAGAVPSMSSIVNSQDESTKVTTETVEPTETKTEVVEPTKITTETVEPTENNTEIAELKELDRLAQEQVEKELAEKLAQEKEAEEQARRMAQEKQELEDKLAQEKIAQEQAEKELAEKLAQEKAAEEQARRMAQEKQELEDKLAQEKIAQEQAEKELAEKLAQEKEAEEEARHIAQEKQELEDKLAQEKIAQEQAEKELAAKLAQEKAAEEQARRIAQEEDARITQQKKELADKELTARLEQQKIAKKRADKLEQQQKAKEREQQEQEQEEAARIAKENQDKQDKEAEQARIEQERELAQLKSELEAKNAELAHIEQTKRLKAEEKQKLEDAFQQRRAQVSEMKEEGELSVLFKKELLARFDGLNTQGKKDLLEGETVYRDLHRDALKSAEQELNRLNTERRIEEARNMVKNAKDMGVNTVNSLWNKAKKLVSSDKQE